MLFRVAGSTCPGNGAVVERANEDRTAFGQLMGSPVPDGWPVFPEAISFTLEHLQKTPEADRKGGRCSSLEGEMTQAIHINVRFEAKPGKQAELARRMAELRPDVEALGGTSVVTVNFQRRNGAVLHRDVSRPGCRGR